MSMDDGGPAFPHLPSEMSQGHPGMSMRDYFAAKAMQVEIGTACRLCRERHERQIAFNAYLMADAMLEARES